MRAQFSTLLTLALMLLVATSLVAAPKNSTDFMAEETYFSEVMGIHTAMGRTAPVAEVEETGSVPEEFGLIAVRESSSSLYTKVTHGFVGATTAFESTETLYIRPEIATLPDAERVIIDALNSGAVLDITPNDLPLGAATKATREELAHAFPEHAGQLRTAGVKLFEIIETGTPFSHAYAIFRDAAGEAIEAKRLFSLTIGPESFVGGRPASRGRLYSVDYVFLYDLVVDDYSEFFIDTLFPEVSPEADFSGERTVRAFTPDVLFPPGKTRRRR